MTKRVLSNMNEPGVWPPSWGSWVEIKEEGATGDGNRGAWRCDAVVRQMLLHIAYCLSNFNPGRGLSAIRIEVIILITWSHLGQCNSRDCLILLGT